MQLLTIEELKNMKVGAQILANDFVKTDGVFACMGEMSNESVMFVSRHGASMMLSQPDVLKTIEHFNIRPIYPHHPLWDEELCKDTQQTDAIIKSLFPEENL
jgi:hypothetical protein